MKAQVLQKPSADQNLNAMRSSETNLVEEREDFQMLYDEVTGSLSRYFNQRPLVATGAVFAIGFYLGWKIKPW